MVLWAREAWGVAHRVFTVWPFPCPFPLWGRKPGSRDGEESRPAAELVSDIVAPTFPVGPEVLSLCSLFFSRVP